MTKTIDNQEAKLHSYLKYKGIYDCQGLFRFMRGWMEKNHYTFFETKYKDKPSAQGREYEWGCKGDKKVDGYYQYWIEWFLHIWDQNPVEIIKDGQKKTMAEGRIMIRFNSIVVLDYEKQFESRSFHNKMQEFLYDHVIREDAETGHWDSLYYELNRFKNEVEAFLNMETAVIGSPYHG